MLELNKLYHMDCMDGMKQFPDKYFELAIGFEFIGFELSDYYYQVANERLEDYRSQLKLF